MRHSNTRVTMKEAKPPPETAGPSKLTRTQRFLKHMMKEDVREKYIKTVDEHVNRLLDSVRVKESKSTTKRGVNSRQKSQQAQINEAKGRVDVTSPFSILTHVSNPRTLLNPQTFASLPMFYQYKLVKALPACDQFVTEQGWIKPSPTSLTNEFFTKASTEWVESLKDGRFTQEYLAKKKQDLERERQRLDPWKVRNFEPLWGQKQISQDDSISEYDRIPKTVIPFTGPRRKTVPKPDFCDDEEESSNGVIPPFVGTITLDSTDESSPRKRQCVAEDVVFHDESYAVGSPQKVQLQQTRRDKPTGRSTRSGTRSATAAARKTQRAKITSSKVETAPDDLQENDFPESREECAVLYSLEGQAASSVPVTFQEALSSGIIVNSPPSVSPTKQGHQPNSSEQILLLTNTFPPISTCCSEIPTLSNYVQSSSSAANLPVTPKRMTRNKRRISGPLMKNAEGIDEMRSLMICQKAVEESSNNKLFFVTNHGKIQQLNQNSEEVLSNDDVPSDSCNVSGSPQKIPLTSDVEMIPVGCPTTSPIRTQNVRSDDSAAITSPTSLQIPQNILATILTNKMDDCKVSQSEVVSLPYKLPNDLIITPAVTSNGSSNQVPVITRTEQTTSHTETSSVWMAPKFSKSLSAAVVSPTNSSDEDCEGVLTRIPSQITVIPLGPTPETSASEEETEYTHMNGHTKDDDRPQESPDSQDIANSCLCDLKALVLCSGCGGLVHVDCIGPGKLCGNCFIECNQKSYGHPSQTVMTNSPATTAYMYTN